MRRTSPSSQTTSAASISSASPGRATIGARSSRSAGGRPITSRSRSMVARGTWCSSSKASSQEASMPHSSVAGVGVTPRSSRPPPIPAAPARRMDHDHGVTLPTAVLGFAVVAAALTVTPGLDTALVLRAAVTGRRREAAATGGGIVGGLFVWGAAAAAGVSALLTASQAAYDVVRYAGAGWLVWFGGRLLWRALRPAPPADPAAASGRSTWRAVR